MRVSVAVQALRDIWRTFDVARSHRLPPVLLTACRRCDPTGVCRFRRTYGDCTAGATDAARGAADIVLTEPGLSVIVSAIIGARKIFQVRCDHQPRLQWGNPEILLCQSYPACFSGNDCIWPAALVMLGNSAVMRCTDAPVPCPPLQRMTTYSKYTVAMTFRICFTFGLLTVLYNFYFPTVLIVLLAVFNDGAMIALSKVRFAQ